MLDKFKKIIISDYFMPFMFYVIALYAMLCGQPIVCSIFFVGGCIGDILLEIKELLEKQTNNTINNDGENN